MSVGGGESEGLCVELFREAVIVALLRGLVESGIGGLGGVQASFSAK